MLIVIIVLALLVFSDEVIYLWKLLRRKKRE